jgi:L-alanine-DL-glutamate epimerase-like enolase superfamily enzyme
MCGERDATSGGKEEMASGERDATTSGGKEEMTSGERDATTSSGKRTRYRTRPFSLPLSAPLATAKGEITKREGALVAITTVDGDSDSDDDSAREQLLGVGEATPLPGWTESLAECRDAIAAVADSGQSPGCGAPSKRSPARGKLPSPSCPAARHAVTLAARDALARRRGVSVAETLTRDGEQPASSVPVNATVGDATVSETVGAAESAVAAGFETLKLKVGARDLEADLARVQAVAEAVRKEHTDITLRADANGAWDRETARRALTELDGLVAYVEQPLAATDLDGLTTLRGVGAPVAVDESLAALDPFAVLDAEVADVLVCKPMALGGLARSLAVARTADARDVETVVTTTIDGVVARTAAVNLAAAIPGGGDRAHGLATGDLLKQDLRGADSQLVEDPVPVENGRIAVPDEPGLAGTAFDELV